MRLKVRPSNRLLVQGNFGDTKLELIGVRGVLLKAVNDDVYIYDPDSAEGDNLLFIIPVNTAMPIWSPDPLNVDLDIEFILMPKPETEETVYLEVIKLD